MQSLPPELLEAIFLDVVQATVPEERSITASALSRVCRSFRCVALLCPQLWTCLSRFGTYRRVKLWFIQTCIERSGGKPLDIVLHFYSVGQPIEDSFQSDGPQSTSMREPPKVIGVDKFIQTVLPLCTRWRSCLWRLIPERPRQRDCIYTSDQKFRSLMVNVDLPQLEQLTIKNIPVFPAGVARTSLHPIAKDFFCMSRNLQAITLTNLHTTVLPLASYTQVRSLSITLSGTNALTEHTRLLRRLATSTIFLSHLHLSLTGCTFSRYPHMLLAEFPSVRCLNFEVLDCSQGASLQGNKLLWDEFRMFHFPNAIEMILTLELGDNTNKLSVWNGYHTSLYSFLASNQIHPHRYPLLQSLDVTIICESVAREVLRDRRSHWPIVLFPHCVVPSLKHLRLRSSGVWTLLDGIGAYEPSQPEFFEHGGDVVPIELQTIKLEIPRVSGVVPWISQLVSKMQDQNCWERFSELTIVEHEGVSVLPRDEVKHWCDAI